MKKYFESGLIGVGTAGEDCVWITFIFEREKRIKIKFKYLAQVETFLRGVRDAVAIARKEIGAKPTVEEAAINLLRRIGEECVELPYQLSGFQKDFDEILERIEKRKK